MSEDPFANAAWEPIAPLRSVVGPSLSARIVQNRTRRVLVIGAPASAGFPAIGERVAIDMAIVGDALAVRMRADPQASRKIHRTSRKSTVGAVRFTLPPPHDAGSAGSIKGAALHPRDDGSVIITLPLAEVTRQDRGPRRQSPSRPAAKLGAAPKATSDAGALSHEKADVARELSPRKVIPMLGGKWSIEGETYTREAVIQTINNQRRRKGQPLLAPTAELIAA